MGFTRIVLPAQAKITANVSMSGYKITKLGTPTSASDAVHKKYVDDGLSAIENTVVGKYYANKVVGRATATNWSLTTSASIIPQTLSVYRNGQKLAPGAASDYQYSQEDPVTLQFVFPSPGFATDEVVLADYFTV